MDANSFREFGRAAIDFCADYLENIGDRFVKNWRLLLDLWIIYMYLNYFHI